MPDLLFFLLLGHYIGDFALQSDNMALNKRTSYASLSLHVFIYTITIALFLAYGLYLHENSSFLSLVTLGTLIAIYALHWVQDFIKSNNFKGSKQAYYMDQSIHIVTLFLIRIYIYGG